MSESNGHLPEWLQELGEKIERLVEEGRRTDVRINALVETSKHQYAILAGIFQALDKQAEAINKLVDVTNAHARQLDEHAELIAHLQPKT